VAEAAEGSVRDGLSILDQAIAHADMASEGASTRVSAEQVREMLGLADKSVQRRLFGALLGGDGVALLDLVADQFALGVEPLALMRSAMELVHRVTVARVGKADVRAIGEEERQAIEGWAKQLTPGQLHRLWQLLLKGHDEVKTAPEPLAAAEMALLRCLHAADMPDPGALVKKIEGLAASGAFAPGAANAALPVAEAPVALSWSDLVEQVEHHSIANGSMMRLQVRVVDLAPGKLAYEHAPGFPDDISAALKAALQQATGARWEIERRASGGAPTLVEVAEQARAAQDAAQRQSPLVLAAMAAFPGAEILEDDAGSGGYPRRQSYGNR